jgi:hypothetical protein
MCQTQEFQRLRQQRWQVVMVSGGEMLAEKFIEKRKEQNRRRRVS